MPPILVGIFVLFCTGFVVGQSYLFIRHQETPKEESRQQVMMQRDQNPGKATGTSPEGRPDSQENPSPDQELKRSAAAQDPTP